MTHHSAAHRQDDTHHPHWPLATILFLFVFLIGAHCVHRPETWLHIRTGADIIAKHSLPHTDTFSYTCAGRPWTTDTWLTDVAFRLLYHSLGYKALVVAKGIAVALAFALLLPISAGSPLVAAAVLGLGAAAAWPGMAETPAALDFLFLALLIRVLRPKKPFSWSTVLQVGFVELLWSNFDGATAGLGLVLAGLKFIKTSIHAEKEDRLRFSALLIAATLGLALNPRGLGAATGIFSAATYGPFPGSELYKLFIFGGAAAAWVCLQQEFFLSLTGALLLGLSLLSPGLRPLAIMAVCPILTLGLAHFFTPLRCTVSRTAALALALSLLCAWHWRAVYDAYGPAAGCSGPKPAMAGAIDFLRSHEIRGRMFNEPETGCELLALTLSRPVFVDCRAALYGPSFMKDAHLWPERFSTLAETYKFDFALLRNHRAGYAARILDQDLDWRMAYADDDALIYLRLSGTHGRLAADLPPRLATPGRLWPDELDKPLSDPKLQPQMIAELDRWIAQSPDSIQPLLLKAYSLDRLGQPNEARRLLGLARDRLENGRDPELSALLAAVLEKRGQTADALQSYRTAARTARRQGDIELDASTSLRYSEALRRAGDEVRAQRWEKRAKSLLLDKP